jgi:hypothetical protein
MTKPFSIVVAAWMAVLGLSIIGNKEQGAAAFSVSPKINQRPQRILNAIKPKSDHLLMPEDDFLRSNDGAAVDRRAKAATFLGGNNNRQTAEGMAMLFPKAMMLTLWSFMVPILASAVSGGGLDFANMDITGQDFSNGSYKGKDFTQGTRHCKVPFVAMMCDATFLGMKVYLCFMVSRSMQTNRELYLRFMHCCALTWPLSHVWRNRFLLARYLSSHCQDDQLSR